MGYRDALSGLMPVDWLDPYGRTPFADGMETSVDITIVETEDGIRASSVKNPPKAGPSRLMEAIKQALGVDSLENASPCSSQQAADLGKQDDEKDNQNGGEGVEKPDGKGIMESYGPSGSKDRDSNPGPEGSPKYREDPRGSRKPFEGNPQAKGADRR